MKYVKKYIGLSVLIVFAIVSVIIDILLKSDCIIFNEVNRILFTLVTVIAGFWLTCYLLFLEIYKDRYPLKFVKSRYLPQMKYNITYIIYCIIFGCFIIIKNGGVVENIWYGTSSLFTIFVILKYIYDTSKTIMVNTYVDKFCEEISQKLENNENSVKKGVFKDLRYVLDECIVKEEYFVAQNISVRLGEIFCDFLKNSNRFIDNGEKKNEVEDSFDRIVNVGIYQLELCKDINSDLLINEISIQQINNIKTCIEFNQYEWFKKYIKQMSILTFRVQKEGEDKVASETFDIYTSVLERLVEEEKEEWINYMLDTLFSMTTSLNFVFSNINLKYFASLITYGLLECKEGKIYDYIYRVFEDFTSVACRISKGFSDIKVYYALYFYNIINKNNKKHIVQFFNTIFKYTQDRGNDMSWTEFKFYCIREVMEKNDEKIEFNINEYHIKLLVEVIEMKEQYNGYMFLPRFEEKLEEAQYSKVASESVCKDIRYLLNKCIINDNLNMFFIVLKCSNSCMVCTEARNKEIQTNILGMFIWLVQRTKRLSNKQFSETVFIELEDMINKLDKKRAISRDFGDKIILELSGLARHVDSDSHNVVVQVIELFSNFLEENKELHFISNYPERKEKLYKGLFNIAISCVENDFEEGVRRCSNTMGWFTIYSIKQGNVKLTKYLIKLAKAMLEISIDLNITTKTQTFLLTLFTTVGMYCCKESTNYVYIESILQAIQNVDKSLVYTAIKIRTYENDMWDGLLDKNTQHLVTTFKKKYEDYQRKVRKC